MTGNCFLHAGLLHHQPRGLDSIQWKSPHAGNKGDVHWHTPLFLSISWSFYQKVLVNNPCPPVKREGAFEDTMFLIDLLKQSREKEIKEKKVCKLSFEKMSLPYIFFRRIWSEIWHLNKKREMKKRLKAILSEECCSQ